MKDKFIGLENELTAFSNYDNNNKINMYYYFDEFKQNVEKYYSKSESSIRTNTGNGFYVDGMDLEILTPPIALNKGFASRLTDSLIIGRNQVINSFKSFNFTGYSMHWNLTNSTNSEHNFSKIYETIAVPFQIFGLTPLSKGFNVRKKNFRYEILGDSLNNEEQIKATALLLGCALYAIEENYNKTQIELVNFEFERNNYKKIFIPNGRFDFINVKIPSAKFSGKIQVQQYLELFYDWIKPYVKILGKKDEIKNLEDFIYYNKKLEFDKFKYYSYIKNENGKKNGIYLPIEIHDEKFKNQILTEYSKREIPLEGKLLGEYILNKNIKKINKFDWNLIDLKLNNNINGNNKFKFKSIKEIYKNANKLNSTLPKYKKAIKINFKEIKTKDIQRIDNFKIIKYQEKKDNFNEFKNFKEIIKYNFKNINYFDLLNKIAFTLALGSILSYGTNKIVDYFQVQSEVKKILKLKK